MKYFITFLFFSINQLAFSQVGIGTSTPATSAQLDLTSTTRGLLPPRMTTSQRDVIVSPVAGLVIYNTTTSQLEIYNGSSWNSINSLIGAALPMKKLYGTTDNDALADMKATPDGGFIFTGRAQTPNTGSLIGITGFTLDIWVVKMDAKGAIEWQKLFGGSGIEGGNSIALCADGGYAVTGYTNSSNGTFTGSTFNGVNDVFLIKLDAAGNLQWQKLFGGNSTDRGYSVQQTADNGFIISGHSFSTNSGTLTGINGNGNLDGYLIKTDASGTILWQKLMGGTLDDEFAWLQVCTDGSFIVCGNSFSSNTGNLLGVTNNGSNDAYILRLTSAGNLIWQKLLGGSLQEYAFHITQTSDLGFIFCGNAASLNTGTLTGTTNNGGSDGWMIKMDGNGNLQWQKLLGGSNAEYLYTISQLPDNGFIVSGNSSSSNTGTLNIANNGFNVNDSWIIRLDLNGNTLWQKLYGGTVDEFTNRSIVNGDGSIILGSLTASSNTGSLTGLVSYGGSDVWLFKLDKFGNPF
ncbi:MAG: hypothetical protein ABIW38_13150 [Ferruginibacter sp.]